MLPSWTKKKHQKNQKKTPTFFSVFDHPQNKAKWQWLEHPCQAGLARAGRVRQKLKRSALKCAGSSQRLTGGQVGGIQSPKPSLGGPARPGRSTVRPGPECSAPARDGPGFPRDGLTCSSVLVLTLDRLRRVSNEYCLCSTGG